MPFPATRQSSTPPSGDQPRVPHPVPREEEETPRYAIKICVRGQAFEFHEWFGSMFEAGVAVDSLLKTMKNDGLVEIRPFEGRVPVRAICADFIEQVYIEDMLYDTALQTA